MYSVSPFHSWFQYFDVRAQGTRTRAREHHTPIISRQRLDLVLRRGHAHWYSEATDTFVSDPDASKVRVQPFLRVDTSVGMLPRERRKLVTKIGENKLLCTGEIVVDTISLALN